MNIQIIVDAIFVILTAGVFWAWTKYIRPWIQEHHLVEAADVAVRAVQALYGRYHGEQKLQRVMEMLAQQGWDIDSSEVLDCVRAAWLKLDHEQIQVGIKHVE